MNAMRNVDPRRNFRAAILFVACLVEAVGLRAQTESIAQRLPPNIVFCAQWQGTHFLADADKRNHVLQLVEDPATAPAWLALATRMQQRDQKPGAKPPAMAMPEIVSLLDNPLTFGIAENPNPPAASTPGAAPARFGFFVVYDATGKASLIQKWKATSEQASKTPAEVASYDFGGTAVEVRTVGKNVTYSAQAAKYYVSSDQKSIVEDLITRFRGSAQPATSMTQRPEYQQIRKFIGSDAVLEWFARVPDVNELKIPGPNQKSAAELAKNLQLEKIHVAGGGLSFSGEPMRVRAEALGDTSPGGLFDIVGASAATFQTQAVVNGSATFSISRLNLVALYTLGRGAATGSLTPQQAGNLAMIEGAAQSFLGMPIADALGLFTGEFASVSSYSDDGTVQQLYAVNIQKPEAVLRILRALMGSMIVAEDTAGTTVYLDVAYPYRDPKTGTQRKRFYYVAVTPQMLLAAPRKSMLREAMTRLSVSTGGTPARGVFANPEYSQMRSLFPANLSGLSGADMAGIPWDKLLANLESQQAQAAKQSNSAPPPDLSVLKPEVISRHLHLALSGWWKDSSGVYFDSYIQ